MSAIMGISIQSSVSQLSTLKVTVQGDDTGAREKDPTKVDFSGVTGSGNSKAAEGSSGSGDSEPAHIKQLREMIKQLQKQLAEEQKQLGELMRRKMDETTKLSLVSAKQASISTLNGQIQVATAQLLEALAKAGGSSAGGVVNTQA
ncbi:hypothetical protein ACQKPE_12770 [Pseudomonas sp. NPDC089554]|uniref:hypothetical protein n=1 Tax=Pseudomonas sp. NPDC089554 TaxID=3390653 RepID=UPI003D084FD7